MNALISRVTLLLMVFVFVACEPQKGNIQFSNPTEEIAITIEANRESSMDAWKTNIAVKPFDREGVRLMVETHVGNFSNDNVVMDWDSDYSGVLTFIETDKTKRRFKLEVDEQNTYLYELKEKPSF
jgi:hypothetical protein